MAVTQQQTVFSYTANGSATAYSYGCRILDDDDLKVKVDDVLKTKDVDYTVSGVGASAGGSVTFLVAPTAGLVVRLYRATVLERTTDYQTSGDFQAQTVNPDFDRAIMALQDILAGSVEIANALRVPAGEVLNLLPIASARASKLLAFDAAGQPVALVGVDAGSAAGLDLSLRSSVVNTAGAGQVGYSDALTYPAGSVGAAFAVTYGATGSAALNLRSYIDDDGAYNVMGFIAQSLKAAIRNFTSNTTLDTQIQAALTAANVDARGLNFPRGRFNLTTGLSLSMNGNRLSQGISIRGAGRNSTVLRQVGTPTQLLKFTNSSPSTGSTSIQLMLENMTFQGVTGAPTVYGLTLESVQNWTVRNVLFEGFTRGINLQSALVGTIDTCEVSNCTNGIISRLLGTSSYCNAVTLRKCTIVGNTTFGVDIGAADGFLVDACVLEANGTSGNTATGAVMIRATCDDETGYSQIKLRDCKYEVNLGRGVQMEANTGVDLILDGGYTLSQESGRDIVVLGARRVSIRDHNAKSNPSVWDLTCDQLALTNTRVTTLTDSGVTTPTYVNAEVSSTTFYSGRASSYTGTLTGCTTSPTGTVSYTQQGKTVRIRVTAALTGTSNTTASTITGMPVAIRPTANRQIVGVCIDSNVSKPSDIVIGSTGVITLANGGAAFTAAGVKGIDLCEFTYEI